MGEMIENNAEELLQEIEEMLKHPERINEGLQLLNKLANAGNTKAMLRFARLFEEDKIYKRDYAKEMQCLLEADKLDDPEAAFQIGRLYRLGLGVKIDLEMAIYYFKKAAKKGIKKAYYHAAVLSFECGRAAEGVKLLTKSINAGIGEARYDYAMCLLHGEGVEQNTEKAIRILENCARDGEYDAAEKLAFMYKTGYRVERSERMAEEYSRLLLRCKH